jgi:hypothetical protein
MMIGDGGIAAPPKEKQKVKSSSYYPSSYSHILNVGTGRALKIEDLGKPLPSSH